MNVSSRNEWKVLTLKGRVDAFSDKRTLPHLKQAVGEGSSRIVLELGECEFLSLWALKSLQEWDRELRTAGGRLVLMTPSDFVLRQVHVFLGNAIEIVNSWEALEVETFYKENRANAPVLAAWSARDPDSVRTDSSIVN